MCFIQQVDGGDEWLSIKDKIVFDSISFGYIIKHGGREKGLEYIKRIQQATEEQCKRLEY
jgi:hypothetical protein